MREFGGTLFQRFAAVAAVAAVVSIAAVALFASSAAAQPFSFTLVVPDVAYVNYGDAAFGDIDGDGLQDLLVIGNRRDEPPFVPSTYQALAGPAFANEFSGVWQMPFESTNLQTGLWHGSLDWRDFDGDGDLDAVVTGATAAAEPFGGATLLLVNDGNGHMVETPADLPDLYASTARWGDYDGDGDADLLLIGAETPTDFRTALFAYTPAPSGVGTFTEVVTSLPDLAYGDIAWADFDNDGDQDVLLAGAMSDGTFVADVFANTSGAFEPLNVPLPGVAFASADWGDFDLDGDLDIVLSGGILSDVLFDGLTNVYRNESSGGGPATFTLAATLPQSFYGDVSWADYDNDGAPDLLVAGSRGAEGDRSARVYRNEGDQFVERSFLTGVSFASAVWADFDGDADVDIVVSGLERESRPLLNVYRNEQRIPNTKPPIPTNLASTSAGGIATLSWDPATDEQSGAGSISYNVRIGTTPDASDVVSSSTATGTSRRLVSARGNADLATSISVALPQGQYYWSVQAIDASFAASDFAPEGVLNVVGKGGQTSSEAAPEAAVFALGEPYPNPSAGAVTLEYSLPGGYPPSETVITVFDVLGSVVSRTSVDGHAGANVWKWDGRGSTGERLASGLYFIQLRTANHAAVRSVFVLGQ